MRSRNPMEYHSMCTFTAEEAFDARENGESIMLDYSSVCAVLEHHDIDDCDPDTDFFAENKPNGVLQWDAADLLDWLGY